jgi:transposase-like protein
MKRSRFKEEQRISILRKGASGNTVKQLCGKANFSDATYSTWKKEAGDYSDPPAAPPV